MTKLLVMTDIHLTAGAEIIGLDPAARFRQGLAHAAETHPDAARLLLLGDLTHQGTPDAYAELAALTTGLPWPVTQLLGNHDRRAPFLDAFPSVAADPSGFVQGIVDLPDARLIYLDTLDEDAEIEHAGLLCDDRLDWLEGAIRTAQRQAIVCMHHPPYDTGFDGMDGIKLANADAFWDVLERHPVDHILCGHIHRTITATVRGTPVTTFKSPCHQMPMTLGDAPLTSSVDEPGAYGILLVREREIVVHFEDFTLPRQIARDY